MAVPLRQQIRIAGYVLGRKLRGEARYPLVLMLEPLFQCNLACAGCGKIEHPDEILQKRLSLEECLQAVDECGAPVVSIPGGEPLVHGQIAEIVAAIVARRKFVYLCTNALLLEKKMDLFSPSPYLTFSVHLDGLQERHDESVCRKGVFEKATAAIRKARQRGFKVSINATLFAGEDPGQVAALFDFATRELGVDGITVTPGYSYEQAPRHDVFLSRRQSKRLFREIFKRRNGTRWPLSHSSLFMDFLCGNQDYQCTPWSNPTRNVFGWQKPCYLMDDAGYAGSFRELMATTPWESYGSGRHPRCNNCMAHCGYEGTAVEDSIRHPLKALLASLRGPRTSGEMVPERPVLQRHGRRERRGPGVATGSEAERSAAAKARSA